MDLGRFSQNILEDAQVQRKFCRILVFDILYLVHLRGSRKMSQVFEKFCRILVFDILYLVHLRGPRKMSSSFEPPGTCHNSW